jgi:S1-C subfamily serine protease
MGWRRRHWLLTLATAAAPLVGSVPARADLVAAIAKVKPSILIVGVYKPTNSPRFTLRGTGFVVGPGNLAITNAHVIPEGLEADPEARIVVQVRGAAANEWQSRPANLLDMDKEHDLALLQVEGAAIAPLRLRDSETVQEGQAIAFMGFPIGGILGFSPVTHRGTISSITAIAPPSPTSQQLSAKAIRSLRSGSFDIFQLDAVAYPGNSGGPLFDADTGEVLGVINSGLVKGTKEAALTNPTGITYAIPGKFIAQLLQRRGNPQ